MNATEIYEVAGAVMLSLGGAGTILYGLSNFLGNIFIERKKVDLDNLRKDYELEIEKNKSMFLRFSETQFSIYNDIWVALCELENSADTLWHTAIGREVREFAINLKKAKHEIRKGALIIENDHYNQLMELFGEFEQFEFGKTKLVELVKDRKSANEINQQQIHKVVLNNGAIRDRYTDLLEAVKKSLSAQIKNGN